MRHLTEGNCEWLPNSFPSTPEATLDVGE